jgi:nucleoside-diphosphate-sugar epimerase
MLSNKKYLVTGGRGFVGRRLIEMLLEKNPESIISLDIDPISDEDIMDQRVQYVTGDISNIETVKKICEKPIDCVFHLAALVGPYHPVEAYERVNFQGTVNIVDACKKYHIPRLVFSSSPGTRFTGENIRGLREDQLPALPLKKTLSLYGETKARGEMYALKACSDTLLVCAIAPHQVYGPRDRLFLSNMLAIAGQDKLRIFGNGKSKVSFTHIDNYCHGLMLGEEALYPNSPALGKFYIVTDGETHTHPEGYGFFYEEVDKAVVAMGFTSIYKKSPIPYYLLIGLAYLNVWLSRIMKKKAIFLPFSVIMMTIDRWFDISNAKRDLKYTPITSFKEEWPKTIEWFRKNWLPVYFKNKKPSIAEPFLDDDSVV